MKYEWSSANSLSVGEIIFNILLFTSLFLVSNWELSGSSTYMLILCGISIGFITLQIYLKIQLKGLHSFPIDSIVDWSTDLSLWSWWSLLCFILSPFMVSFLMIWSLFFSKSFELGQYEQKSFFDQYHRDMKDWVIEDRLRHSSLNWRIEMTCLQIKHQIFHKNWSLFSLSQRCNWRTWWIQFIDQTLWRMKLRFFSIIQVSMFVCNVNDLYRPVPAQVFLYQWSIQLTKLSSFSSHSNLHLNYLVYHHMNRDKYIIDNNITDEFINNNRTMSCQCIVFKSI